MPRSPKGPRLYFDRGKRLFVIRDGPRKRGTGCGEGERERAEIALRDYNAAKFQPVSDSRPDKVLVADVLTYYSREIAPSHRASATTGYAIDRLLEWWKTRPLSDVKRSTCREYVEHRTRQPRPQAKSDTAKARTVSTETARRELSVLRAAINAYHAEHTLDAVPIVTLPPAAPPRERWLTRKEVAALLAAARRHPRSDAGEALIRFILVSVYTGTRSGAVRALRWMPSPQGGWVDLEAGVMHRRPAGERESKKARPPARIPPRLLRHLRRWRKQDERAKRSRAVPVVHFSGAPVALQRRAWRWACDQAGLGVEVVPHTLRHTAATWMMQGGISVWDAAGFLGMSPEVLWEVYGHHHPDWQRDIADKIGRR